MNDYVNLFISEEMIGEEGNLSEIGLIPLPEADREATRNRVDNHSKLTADDLSKK